MNELGDKVRLLREEKGLSRPVFCGDESELSVRQLVRIEKGQLSSSEQQKLQLMFQKVCNNVEKSGTDDLFLVRDVLFAGLGSCELLNDLELFKLAVEKLNWISEKTRDFQKQPIVLMVEWKYYLQTDYDTAKQKYEEAKMMARMFGNEKLIVSLDNEWSKDNKIV